MSNNALAEMIAAFELSLQSTQSILDRLQSGEALESLEDLFRVKATALEALKRAAVGLGAIEKPSPLEMARVHELQASSARLEAKLAETLGQRQRSVGNVSAITKAYGSKGLDKEPSRRLDLET
jgi:hypothetical protein